MNKFALPVQQPFDWESLLAFLRLRATPGVEIVTDSAYTRTIAEGAAAHAFSVTYDSATATLQVDYSGKASELSLVESRAKQMFKPHVSTAPIETFLNRDPWLCGFVQRQAGLRVPGGWSALEIAMRAILGQQVSVPAATTLMGRLVRAAGARLSELSWLFPTAEQIAQSDLGGLGIPGSRMETVKTLAAFFAEHGEQCLEHADIRNRLLALKGIGKWTAGYILMRTATSRDHWPEGDLILRKALSDGKTMIAHAVLERAFSRWSPYRSYATIHIWKGYAPRERAPNNETRALDQSAWGRVAWDNECNIHIHLAKYSFVKEVLAMEPKSDEPKTAEPKTAEQKIAEQKTAEPKPGEQPLSEPIQHITGAHQLLTSLSEKFGAIHPELNEAITKLELALSALTVNTGGMF
jgi:DNA-3-methyladenine glycosylase II